MRRAQGFTLIEVIISGTILSILVALALGMMGTMSEHVADATVSDDLHRRGLNAAAFIQRQLRPAARSTIVLASANPNYTIVSYQQVEGFDADTGTKTLGPLENIAFVLDSGETDDDADNDGDGIADDGRLVLYRGGAEVADIATGVRQETVEFSLWDNTPTKSTDTTPDSDDTFLYVSFQLQQRGRRVGVMETHTQAFHIGLRN